MNKDESEREEIFSRPYIVYIPKQNDGLLLFQFNTPSITSTFFLCSIKTIDKHV
jgi:hypothetical protein